MAIYAYQTEELTNFKMLENQNKMEEALNKVMQMEKRTYPLLIGGKEVYTETTLSSINPSTKEVLGQVCQASITEANRAMELALHIFKSWKNTSPAYRSTMLLRAAAILKRKRHFFNALMVIEAGKPWIEADADTAEAIDFLEYYARQILECQNVNEKIQSRTNLEVNEYRYIPLGVGIVISPWNFPLAILTGMSSAAIVSGNCVLIKPSSNTQIIAYHLMEVFKEAGIPDGVFAFLPGKGSEIGEFLVNHPKTRFISFTGSKEVGINIYEKAAKVQPGQIWLKRVIAEMGGKDAIIVDDDCDLEQASNAIVQSAFGFSGQKCSACSRAIIHKNIYDALISKIVEKAKLIKVGNPFSKENNMGPVIDQASFKKINNYIEIGKKEGKLVLGGSGNDQNGFFITPTIIVDLDPKSRIMQEEIFGPVLGITKANSFTDAIKIANDSEYGLTGAVFSNNRLYLEFAKSEFHVGNLYINRKCTGAIVGYQPFGGFNLSGTDSKAGGPEYLILHMQGQSVSEQL